MIRDIITKSIGNALQELNLPEVSYIVEHPLDLSHGDYSTNAALALSKESGKKPRDLAEEIIRYIVRNKPKEVEKVDVAGPGFINFHLSREFFAKSTEGICKKGDTWGKNETIRGKQVMVEYTDPNPFKEFHIGHLMNNTIGESISRLIEFSGAEVRRANYQGDVGVHVAKALWGKREKPELSWGDAYAYGAAHYESNKADIDVINRQLYERSDDKLNTLYDEGRSASLKKFELLYKVLGTAFDCYFFESDAAPIGRVLVEKHRDIFEESEGAIVFRGEEHDPALHTRVFITSQGIPTYEAKELGLVTMKFDTWPHDLSVVVTASEITDYYRVVMKALEQIDPERSAKIKHVPHGFLRLTSGKMSSREGDVVTALSLISDMKKLVLEKMRESDSDVEHKDDTAQEIAVAAIKYSVLKQDTGKDIVFDKEKELSFEGDSGPYLQYTHARARSVLVKGGAIKPNTTQPPGAVMELERLLYRFPEVVERAAGEYEPHYATTFLTELAGAFNSWYAEERILGSEHEAYRIALVQAFSITMKNGLWLLGVEAPERM